MAILQGGIMQGFSGKVGKIVGARVNGQDTIRAYQPMINNPKSPTQVENRNILKEATQFVAQNVDQAYRSYGFRGYTASTGFGMFVAACILYLRSQLSLSHKEVVEGMISKGVSPRYDIFDGTTFIQDGLLSEVRIGGKTAVSYFGSDELLENSNIYAFYRAGAAQVIAGSPKLTLLKLSSFTTNFEAPEGVAPKVVGLQDSNIACGNWKYIYEINPVTEIASSKLPVYLEGDTDVIQFAFVGVNSMTSLFIPFVSEVAP